MHKHNEWEKLISFIQIPVIRIFTNVLHTSVFQPPSRGQVPIPGINFTGPRVFLLELITNSNVILYLSTCHILHIIVLILFMIMS